MQKSDLTIENILTAVHKIAGDEGKKILEDQFGKEKFLKRPIMERIDTFADILEDQGLTEEQFEKMTEHDDEDDKSNKAIKLICACLNEGPLDPKKPWYYPVFNRDKGSGFGLASTSYGDWDSSASVGERRSYKSSELAVFAGRKFAHIYKPYVLNLSKNQ